MKTTKVTRSQIRKIYRHAKPDDHKGTRGHALIIGGSYGKIGAICLSAEAALRSGCGLVTAFIPECGYEIVQVSIPEAMVITDKDKDSITSIKFPIKPQAIGIGPGMGQEAWTKKAFYNFMKTNDFPLVIDADGLNILASAKKYKDLLKPGTILTPHPKELERLIGKWETEKEKFVMATVFANQHNVIIVMKGAPTCIISGAEVFQNATGNPALATAGSGDVLTGIITSLLAQSYRPIDAAILGVYLQGLTADIALPETGTESFTASDIIQNLGKAFINIGKSMY
ncbi:NAD(P)H-hydrate dehydratase [Flavobacterium pallidum]|uniref:ADP-dependent (S)-NAD(P)H-hydrate dehydratase n=1 Tax=Flavobacterium pallidum TaxID=2172098 RepID=A0A2S1SJ82_9FLAO|nr:NAD(P)H-hydrate dehydratase [Flavobacterium pallidum]AWI26402.1 NAD(P)H-hydrate dehydratase [Flavobacterium pallidum]